jgi:predicted acylesterase/phospholipase RssA
VEKTTPSWHLASNPLFARVDAEALARFDTDGHTLHLAGGQTLFTQGDPADALFIVARGSLQVIVEHEDGTARLVDTLGRGALVGEMALLLDDTRTATVVACRDSELVRIGKAEFDRLIAEHPSISVEIARMLGARLKRTTRFTGAAPRVRTIALLPITPGAAASQFGEHLTAALTAALPGALSATVAASRTNALGDLGSAEAPAPHEVCHVTPALVDSLHPGAADADPEDEAGRRVLRWMSGLEDRFRYVIYQADPARPTWTRRCLREADVTLLLAHARDDPQPGAIEKTLTPHDERRTPVELVLLHDAGTSRISGTARWLEGRRLARHHHVRDGCEEDHQRVARFLTGRAVGVVLSGGGARGLAHIGVIKALRARGWPIDMIGGASMGAIIAAQYATGHDVDAMIALTRREFAHRQELDLTLPMASLYSAAATVRKMKRLFGDANIEDLPIGYFCTSTNLTRAQSVVHDRGPVWLWTRTSCSIPGLAPPVPYEGDLLVDGGLLNNLPADVMRQRCNGVVIGVDVTSGVDLRTSSDSRPHVSGWPLLWERVTRRRRPTVLPSVQPSESSQPLQSVQSFPTIVDILSRTALVGSIRDASRMQAHCDVYLVPPVERFSMSDFRELDALVDAGYRATAATIAQWPISE